MSSLYRIFSLYLLFSESLVLAQEPNWAGSVILLASEQSRSCGTGALLATGEIVTSLHLIRSVCPEQSCAALRIFRPGEPMKEVHNPTPLKISLRSPARDIAVLIGLTEPGTLTLQPPNSPLPEQAQLISFPHCQSLSVTSGALNRISPLQVTSSAQGAYGSSGGPLITKDGTIVAIVDEASTISTALWAKATGGRFPVRATLVDSSLINPNRTTQQHFSEELDLLEQLIPEPGWGLHHLRQATDFIVAVDHMTPPADLPPELLLRFELLHLRQALLRDKTAPILEPLNKPTWYQQQWHKIRAEAQDNPFPGTDRYGFWLLQWTLLPLLCCAALLPLLRKTLRR